MAYTLHNSPPPILWISALYGYVAGFALFLLIRLYGWTLRTKTTGEVPRGPCILSFWHENLLLYMLRFPSHPPRQVWLQHPRLYMRPVHVLLRLLGAKVVYGSSGNGGRAALEQVLDALCNGSSTVINPDGPMGPPRELKSGVVELGRRSSLPVVPLSLRSDLSLVLPTWDGKSFPLPFSTVHFHYHSALRFEKDQEVGTVELKNGMDGVAL
jgi:lysophospholipid acyltransferase (LPLAT)-like uncharacterized protein